MILGVSSYTVSHEFTNSFVRYHPNGGIPESPYFRLFWGVGFKLPYPYSEHIGVSDSSIWMVPKEMFADEVLTWMFIGDYLESDYLSY